MVDNITVVLPTPEEKEYLWGLCIFSAKEAPRARPNNPPPLFFIQIDPYSMGMRMVHLDVGGVSAQEAAKE